MPGVKFLKIQTLQLLKKTYSTRLSSTHWNKFMPFCFKVKTELNCKTRFIKSFEYRKLPWKIFDVIILHANNDTITKNDGRVLHSSGMSFWSSSKDEKEKKIQKLENYILSEDLLAPCNKNPNVRFLLTKESIPCITSTLR